MVNRPETEFLQGCVRLSEKISTASGKRCQKDHRSTEPKNHAPYRTVIHAQKFGPATMAKTAANEPTAIKHKPRPLNITR